MTKFGKQLLNHISSSYLCAVMSETKKRIVSIDILRCIAIIGMVMSSNIGTSSGLPGWMFHAQTPPPSYAFAPECVGITWVDLVFPFFLLSMGAALPFALKKRISRGTPLFEVFLGLVKRCLILTVFAVVLGNAYRIWQSPQPDWSKRLFQIGIWVVMCLSLMRMPSISERLNRLLNLCGLALLVGSAFVLKSVFGVSLDLGSDIIIMILAQASLWGGLIWVLTRDSLPLRWVAITVVVAVKALASYLPSHFPMVGPAFGWCFQWSYLQYLIPVLVGSVIGDMILTDRKHSRDEDKKVCLPVVILSILLVILQLWGLYTRRVMLDLVLTAVIALLFFLLTRKCKSSVWRQIGVLGMALTLLGVGLDPIDGGIAKDYCNLSYLFTTSGLGLAIVSVLLCVEQNLGLRAPFLSSVGQNPMVAYTVSGFVIGPILSLTGILPWLWNLSVGSPFWGVTQGVILTLLMMLCTSLCTKVKLFWRS